MKCPVCDDVKIDKKYVECFKCSYKTCRICVQTYLLGQSQFTPKCMSCNVPWGLDFIYNNTESKFFDKDYREYRANILFKREEDFFPQTQLLIASEKKKEIIKNEISEITKQIYLLQEKRKKLIATYSDGLNLQENEIKFSGHCPSSDCKGSLSQDMICVLCETKACKKCKQTEHTGDCDKNIIETIKMLQKDTKPCPKCTSLIYKTDGCDQMFCVMCHTAFSWNTGKIETGRLHNPHYYEWLRKNNRNAREVGDVLCGGPVYVEDIFDLIREEKYLKYVSNAHMISSHIRGVILPSLNTVYNQDTYSDVRKKYLENKIVKSQYLDMIKRRDKKREKNESLRDIYSMLADTVDEIFRKFVNGAVSTSEMLIELKNLREYFNESTLKVKKRFKSQIPVIEKRWLLNYI